MNAFVVPKVAPTIPLTTGSLAKSSQSPSNSVIHFALFFNHYSGVEAKFAGSCQERPLRGINCAP
jgi:hypothetical protein